MIQASSRPCTTVSRQRLAASAREGPLDRAQLLPAIAGARQRPGPHRQDGLDDRRWQVLGCMIYGFGRCDDDVPHLGGGMVRHQGRIA
jgi:hypothetical protein